MCTGPKTSDRDREIAAAKEKTGVFTGAYAINPVNGEKLPVWIADYVKWITAPAPSWRCPRTMSAIMPLPKTSPCRSNRWWKAATLRRAALCRPRRGHQLRFSQRPRHRRRQKENDCVAGRKKYRQGPHHLQAARLAVQPSALLGRTLPAAAWQGWKNPRSARGCLAAHPAGSEDYRPTDTGEPPLARATDWLKVKVNGEELIRETNTMPQWAGSCWYYLRFMDPKNSSAFVGREAEQYWGQVDLYIGGVEHAVLHLLYARFWHKVLFDCGLVSHPRTVQASCSIRA
jgi:leucyl-tRNA synthetase